MIYIVDGTGPYTEAGYAIEMAGSHCQIINHLNKGGARYWRGPTVLDIWTRTAQIASVVFQDVMSKEFPAAFLAPGARQLPSTPIYLVGYSRGGAAMVMVAKMLAKPAIPIPVAGLFLFDAVAKTSTLDNLDTVPGNVEKCYHAVRNEGAQVIMEFEERQLWKKCQQAAGFKEVEREFAAIGSGLFEDFLVRRSARYRELHSLAMRWQVKSRTLRHFKVAMRNSLNVGSAGLSTDFENCARKHASVKEWELKEFAGSHGALGGVPATDKGDEIASIDREASLGAWTWMASRMRQCGIQAGKGLTARVPWATKNCLEQSVHGASRSMESLSLPAFTLQGSQVRNLHFPPRIRSKSKACDICSQAFFAFVREIRMVQSGNKFHRRVVFASPVCYAGH